MNESVEWELVESSNVAGIGYNAQTKELHVQFKSGAVYVYQDVSFEVVEAFKEAPSKGKYFNEHIKGAYEFEKIV